jgi:hypothetical protein
LTPLDFLLGAFFVILGFGFLSFSVRLADRLPLLAMICYGMKAMGEPTKEMLKGIGLFTAFLGGFILIAMIGSMLFAKGLIWLLPL